VVFYLTLVDPQILKDQPQRESKSKHSTRQNHTSKCTKLTPRSLCWMPHQYWITTTAGAVSVSLLQIGPPDPVDSPMSSAISPPLVSVHRIEPCRCYHVLCHRRSTSVDSGRRWGIWKSFMRVVSDDLKGQAGINAAATDARIRNTKPRSNIAPIT